MEKRGVKEFLKRKNVTITVQTYLIDALGAMAFGLFASLLIGTIFGTLGKQFNLELFNVISDFAKSATGAALGVAIAYALHAPALVLFSAATVGIAGNTLGGPVGALAATVIATELGKMVSKETRLDILVTPGVTIISGVLVAQFVGPGVAGFMNWFGSIVKNSNRAAAILHGHTGIRSHRYRSYPSHQQRGHLYCPFPGRAGRRSCNGGMLCSDGWICRSLLPGKRSGRSYGPGTWYQHAADGKYREES